MANKSTFLRETEIRVCAWLFVHKTRDAHQIAKETELSARTVIRHSKTKLWARLLDEWGYTGERNFRVNRAGRKRKV